MKITQDTGMIPNLFGSLFCGLSGHWVPEGAALLVFAIFVWFLTLGSISFGRGSKV